MRVADVTDKNNNNLKFKFIDITIYTFYSTI